MIFIRKVKSWIKAAFIADRKACHLFPKTNSVIVTPDFITGKYINISIPSRDVKIEIKENVLMREFCNIIVEAGAELIINKNVFFNNYCSINCLDKIIIGDNTLFGEGVKLYDHNHTYSVSPNVTVERNNFKTGAITIGSNCWIGSNVTILKGVTIGNNVIIGANNLIHKSVASNTIVKSKNELIFESY